MNLKKFDHTDFSINQQNEIDDGLSLKECLISAHPGLEIQLLRLFGIEILGKID
jgi:hypothetical protein